MFPSTPILHRQKPSLAPNDKNITAKNMKTGSPFFCRPSFCRLILTTLLLAPLAVLHAAEPVTSPGDRNLPITQIYPPQAFYHNGKGGRVLDVTKPPFNAKGDGKTDDTQALCDAMRFVRDHYEDMAGNGYSYCNYKYDRNWIIYLPNGEYLVSNTISQGWPARAYDIKKGWAHCGRVEVASPEAETPELELRGERNYGIRVVGQSRQGTMIRLKDQCPGFEKGKENALLQFYLLKNGSSINQGNYAQNLTLYTGKGNPGAVGMKWNASNWGGIYNVALRSGDGSGRAGLMMDRRNAHGYQHDLVVDGFDVGVEMAAGAVSNVVLEYATLTNQRQAAVRVSKNETFCGRKLLVKNAPMVLRAAGSAHAVLLDCEAVSEKSVGPAIAVEGGHLLARDIRLSGYASAVAKDKQPVVAGDFIEEYVSGTPVSAYADGPTKTLRLPVKETPVILPESDLSKWASVDDFGAKGDGITDDTEPVQRAMNSGKPVVWFPKACYAINGTVAIPATVREVAFLWSSVYRTDPAQPTNLTMRQAGELLIKGEPPEAVKPALFRVAQGSDQPLLIRQGFHAGSVFLDHEAQRPVILDDMVTAFQHARYVAGTPGILFPGAAAQKTSLWRLYRNTKPDGAPKEVFANMVQGFAGGGEDACLAVQNVHAWVRQLDNEYYTVEVAFQHSDAWILGYKGEMATASGTFFHASDQSRLELLGGLYHPRNGESSLPLVVSIDSEVALSLNAFGGSKLNVPVQSVILRDQRKGQVTEVPDTRFEPRRTLAPGEKMIPLLTNTPK